MESQRQDGGQDNHTLALRTKVDWCLRDLTQCLPFATPGEKYLNLRQISAMDFLLGYLNFPIIV
jgi:hypothetical protein